MVDEQILEKRLTSLEDAVARQRQVAAVPPQGEWLESVIVPSPIMKRFNKCLAYGSSPTAMPIARRTIPVKSLEIPIRHRPHFFPARPAKPRREGGYFVALPIVASFVINYHILFAPGDRTMARFFKACFVVLALMANAIPYAAPSTRVSTNQSVEGKWVERLAFEVAKQDVKFIEFSPDGKSSLAGGGASNVAIFNLVKGNVSQTFKGIVGLTGYRLQPRWADPRRLDEYGNQAMGCQDRWSARNLKGRSIEGPATRL